MSCYLVLRLDGNRRLVLTDLKKKALATVLGSLGHGIIVRETEVGFEPEPATDSNDTLAQDLSGVFEIITNGDPRVTPIHRWGREGWARIQEIRKKSTPPDPLLSFLRGARAARNEGDLS